MPSQDDPVPQIFIRQASEGLPDVVGGPQGFLRRGLERQIEDRIISMEYEETDVGADEVTLTLENQDLQLFRNSLLIPNIGIWDMFFGWVGRMGPKRTFVTVEVSGFRVLTIRALNEPEYRLSRVSRCIPHRKSRISDIVRDIAKRNNMVSVTQATPFARTKKAQSNQSDAQFLKLLAEEIGFVWYVEKQGSRDRLHFLERDFKADPFDPPVEYFIGSDPRVLSDPDYSIDVFDLFGLVETNVFDPLQKIHFTVKADIAEVERRVAGKSSPITSASKITLSTTSQKLLRGEEEMTGVYKQAEKGLIKATLPLLGDPFMRPKRQINLIGVPALLAGTYYVDTITYKVTPQEAFTMELKIRKNAFAVAASDIDFALLRLTEIRADFQQAVEKAKEAEERARRTSIGPSFAQVDVFITDRGGGRTFGLPGE